MRRRHGTDHVCPRSPFVGTGDRLARHLADIAAAPGLRPGELWAWLDTRDAA